MAEHGYKTSSAIVKDIISREGLDAFKIRRIKHFETKEQAKDYETRFLTKVGVPFNSNWYNRHVNDRFTFAGQKRPESFKQMMRGIMLGVPKSPECRANMSKAKKGRPSSRKGIPMSDEQKEKIRLTLTGRINGPRTEEFKQAVREKRLGMKFPQEWKDNIAKAQLGKKRKPHSPETLAKMAAARKLFWEKKKQLTIVTQTNPVTIVQSPESALSFAAPR